MREASWEIGLTPTGYVFSIWDSSIVNPFSSKRYNDITNE